MDEKNKYYSYQVDNKPDYFTHAVKDESLNHTADIPLTEVKADKGFLGDHPWLVTGGLLVGFSALCFMATWGTIEWIAYSTAKKVVKKMGVS